ncbi:MAG: mevalonate kinase [Chloroflexi bacterium]|nr:mevalonate kinase [Chloroflexota bacterium]
MILGVGRAPGKVILFGEHAVVYGRPALAVPVTQVQAEAIVEAGAPGSGLVICAADLGEEIALRDAAADDPLAAAVRLALAAAGRQGSRGAGEQGSLDWRVTVRSTIPIASGMGSGAAVSAAIVRAVAVSANRQIGKSANRQISKSANGEPANRQYAIRNTQCAITPADVSALVYEVEKLHHGTPSGVDNTVIAYGQPVYFVRGQPPRPFPIGRPFMLAIADSGIASPTRIAVGDVRRAWEQDRARFEWLFDAVAAIVEDAATVISRGEVEQLGQLMDANHALLRQIGVSCPELDALAAATRSAGALGAKLSGGGRGGNLIALVTEETAPRVADALAAAGAVRVIVSTVGGD